MYNKSHILIGGIQKTTLVDYPGKVASTIFTIGCNFSCAYCHNPELVCPKRITKKLSAIKILSFLEQRKGKIDAVCISGGEPTIQKNLLEFIATLKEKKLLVKLDTNGTNPEIIKLLLQTNLIDYIAMDIKAPLEKYRFFSKDPHITKKIKKSIKIIMDLAPDYEFRTTCTKPFIFKSNFVSIGNIIKGAKKFFIQNYIKAPKQLHNFIRLAPFDDEELLVAKYIMKQYTKNVYIR
jgi:pyruvate formate lyase activating enzyme